MYSKGEISAKEFLARMSNTVNAIDLVLIMIRETLKQKGYIRVFQRTFYSMYRERY